MHLPKGSYLVLLPSLQSHYLHSSDLSEAIAITLILGDCIFIFSLVFTNRVSFKMINFNLCFVLKRNSSGRRRKCKYTPPPTPINVLAAALNLSLNIAFTLKAQFLLAASLYLLAEHKKNEISRRQFIARNTCLFIIHTCGLSTWPVDF